MEDCLLIIDDLKGRKFAQQLGLAIIGAIGVIVDACWCNNIGKTNSIKNKTTNFRLSEKLELLVLKKANE